MSNRQISVNIDKIKYARSRNGRRKPSVPIEKLSTGGTAPTLNNDDAWRMVPSPPRVITRSILWAPWPIVKSYKDILGR